MRIRLKIMIFVLLSVVSFQCSAYADADITVVEKPFLEGQYDKAERAAQGLIDQRSSQRHEVYYLKGLSELKLNKFKEARESFGAIISKYSNSNRTFDAYVGIGDSYFLEGNTEAAIKAYGEAKERFPSDKNIALVDSRLGECRQKTPPAIAPVLPPPAENKPGPVASVETPNGNISVQVGSFKSERNANALSAKLTAKGYHSYVELPVAEGDRLYRVKIGRMISKSEADSLAARLSRDGYKTKICDDNSCR